MNKRGHRQHGAITVFLSIVLIAIIAFMGMLVDLSRMRVAQAQLKRASQLSLDAVMTSYSRRLREDYGLFGYAGGDAESVNSTYMDYLKSNLDPTQTEEKGEYVKLLQTITGQTDVKFGDMLRLSAGDGTSGTGSDPLSDPDVLFHQVMEFSKFRVPIHMLASDTLSRIGDLQNGLNAAEEENKAYNTMNKLGKPMEEYYGDRTELNQAVEALRTAVGNLNTAIENWNLLIHGNANVTVSATFEEGISYNKLVVWDRDEYGYVLGYDWQEMTDSNSPRVSAKAYDGSDTANQFKRASENFAQGLFEKMTGEYKEELDNDDERIRALEDAIAGYEEDGVEVDPNDKARVKAFAERYDDIYDAYVIVCDDEITPYVESYNQRVYDQLWEKFKTELAITTEFYYGEYTRSREAVLQAMQDVEQAIIDLNNKGENVEGTMTRIEGELDLGTGTEKQGIRDEWDANKEQTKKEIVEDEGKIDDLRDSLNGLTSQLNRVATKDMYEPSEVALAFMNIDVIPRIAKSAISWSPDEYKIDTIIFDGQFEVNKDHTDYDSKKNAVDDKKNDAKDELDRLGQSQSDKDRYNGKAIPGKYKDLFVQAGEGNDGATKQEDPGDPKDMSADEASNKGNAMFGGFQDVTNMLNSGVQYVLGAVYGSEYILSMFSNAAPEQEKNEYNSQTFEYARITTLRNAMPVGKPDYEKMSGGDTQLRPGYFYNAEAEYILFGCDKERDNVTRAQVLLQVMFTGANYLQVRRNTALKGAVEAAAAAGAAIGIPPTVTKFVLYLGLAVVESQFDMFYIMRGFSIPVFSRDGDKLFMMNPGNANRVLNEKGQFMLSYEFYLRLRLMVALTAYRDSVMKRMANLITLNVNYAADENLGDVYDGDAGFTMSNAFTTFEANASAKMPYWFMTMAMMGEAQTDSKWYLVPEDRIVSSY